MGGLKENSFTYTKNSLFFPFFFVTCKKKKEKSFPKIPQNKKLRCQIFMEK